MYAEVIAARIRAQMEVLGFSETKLAGDSGLSVDTIKAVLAGADNVRMKTYDSIARAMGKDIFWLFQQPEQQQKAA